jgi:hypothetical protein
VKEFRNGKTLFFVVFLIFASSAQGCQYFFQFLNIYSHYPLHTDRLAPLQENILSPIDIPQAGVIPPLRNTSTPRGIINDIIGGQDQYFPGGSISIQNQFELVEDSDIYIVEQDIYIFLFEETSWTIQQMIDECNVNDSNGKFTGNESAHYVHKTTTNGTQPDPTKPSLSGSDTDGWINTTFTIPDIATLNSIGIQSDDNVTIFQLYPALNVTESRIGQDYFSYKTDRFQVSSVATFTCPDGFINDASKDDTFRQGENATAVLTAASGDTGIDNVTVALVGLYNKSDDSEITDPGSLGIQYALLGTTTNATGDIELVVNTTFSTPEGEYYFNISADFTWTSFYTENYGKITSTIANFIVQNEWDYVDIIDLQAVPSSLDPPNHNTTIVTVRVRAQYAYDTQPYYYLSDIPVTATLDSYPAGVTLTIMPGFGAASGSPGYYLTNSIGQIAYNITAEYPILYSDIVSNIEFTTNLTSLTAPIYPYSSNTYRPPHRFLRGAGDTLDTSTDNDISINPDFWVGDVQYDWSNVTNIRPGQSALVRYEVFSTQTSDTFVDVPVKIELATSIPGVTLDSNNSIAWGNYRFTDVNGYIFVKVTSTYLVTLEYIQSVPLDITVDFENDSNIRWIGNSNAITSWGWADTLQNFNKTWRTRQLTDITIDPVFNNCTISYFTTNESGDTVIRPGDNILVYFAVRDENSNLLDDVPANVSFVDYTTMKNYGVSLIIDPGLDPSPGMPLGYYNTSGGYIIFTISTEYGVTPKNLNIALKATANFEYDSQNKWYVGSKGIRPDFRSNSSYSEGSRSITIAPQYFTGYIYIPTDNPPNATLVQHNEILETEFRLRLSYSGGTVFPSIDGLNISIQINNTDPADWGMEVTPAISQDSVGSSVIFYIQINKTDLTPEDIYTLSVTADFGSLKDRIYNFTSPYPSTVPSPGTLSGVWVNGTDTTGNYSYVSTMFEVKNIDLIRVWIPSGGVTDPFHPDAGFNSATGLFEVYRNTTDITIEGTYKDNTQDPVQNKRIELYLNHTNDERILLDDDVWTDSEGKFSAVINLADRTPLKDGIKIYGEDPNPPTPREEHEAFNNTRVVSTIQFGNHNVNILNGTTVFLGESVSLTGTLHDNLGLPIDSSSSIFTTSFSELTNNIRVVGWNGTHEIGIAQVASPNAGGTYNVTYQVPYDFNLDVLTLRMNITTPGLVHYRANYTQTPINIYWDIQISNLEIYFPDNGTSTGLTNATSYLVSGLNNRDFIIRGTLEDSSGRGLGRKWINTTWNDEISPSAHPVDDIPAGYFTLDYSFPGLENGTWVWEFHHLLDNGTELSKFYNITLNWIIFDITAPTIVIISPTENLTSPGVAFLLPNDVTQITVTIEDPSDEDVSEGLDDSSVVIQINGDNNSMNQAGQDTFSYDWATPKDSLLDITYNIIIFASDVAHNWNTAGITVVFDVIAPTGTMTVQENENGYLEVDSDGFVRISGNIEANNSDTGLNFGLDEESARIFIINSQLDEIEINESIIITDNSYSYNWGIILNPDNFELLQRNGSFTGYTDWTILVTFSDLAGNDGNTSLDVNLEKSPPSIEIDKENLPEEVDKELTITVSFEDPETGIYIETLTFEILNSTNNVIYTIRYGEANFESETNSEVTLIIDSSDPSVFPTGVYTIKVQIRDNTGNLGEDISLPFTISHPSPPNPFTNIILLLVSPVLAFGGGVGIAALYERIRGLRGA